VQFSEKFLTKNQEESSKKLSSFKICVYGANIWIGFYKTEESNFFSYETVLITSLDILTFNASIKRYYKKKSVEIETKM